MLGLDSGKAALKWLLAQTAFETRSYREISDPAYPTVSKKEWQEQEGILLVESFAYGGPPLQLLVAKGWT